MCVFLMPYYKLQISIMLLLLMVVLMTLMLTMLRNNDNGINFNGDDEYCNAEDA